MTQQRSTRYEFPPELPIEDVHGGANVAVTGPREGPARAIALQLLTAGMARDEGVLLVSTDEPATALLERCESVTSPLDRTSLAIVDCSDDEDPQRRFDDHVEAIEGPGDLTAINAELSVLYETLVDGDQPGVRIGVLSVTSMFGHADPADVTRFVHMLTGRVLATGDLGVFLVDSTATNEATIDTILQFCDGAVDVRLDEDRRSELRVTGFDREPTEWLSLEDGTSG